MKRYGARKVVRDVSVSVKSGEVVGLLGPNGAGKTTTFYMIVGLVPPNGGDILLNDNPITHLPIFKRARLGVSYLPQEASVFRKLTVEDNIRAILELQYDKTGARLSRTEIEKRLNNLLDELQIQHIRTNTALSLSGAGVDPIAVIEIQRIVRFLKDRGIGVLITDHNVRETLGICDHAYIINEGEVLAQGSPEEIISNESVRKIYLGENFRM